MKKLCFTYLSVVMLTFGVVNAQEHLPGHPFYSGQDGDYLQTSHSAVNFADKDLAKRVKKLEAEIKKVKTALQPGHSESKMRVVGRVHADYWGFPGDSPGVNIIESTRDIGGGTAGNPLVTPQDRLGFRRVRFGVRGTLPANMEYRIEMEFAGGNNSEFRDAWLGWNDLPFLRKLLIGNQKRPYGLDHLNSSRYNVFMERPWVIESFNQDARRLGMCSYGVSEDQNWNWRYGVYNQRLVQDEGNYVSDHLQLQFAGRLANTIWYDECSGGRGYAHWAVSGTLANPDGTGGGARAANEARFRHRPEARSSRRWLDTGRIAGADTYGMLGLEAVLNVGPMSIVGEYQFMNVDRSAGFGNAVSLHGGYVYASYFLTGEHRPWSRKSGTLGRVIPFENAFWVRTCDGCTGGGWGAWEIAARYSYADFNDENIAGGIGQSVTIGVNWYLSPYARIQFNYIVGEILNRDANNNNALAPNIVSGNFDIIGLRAMVDF
ncbi:MAG: porin [Planctomycetota bacterium]|nr:porin [Planctomycetota bacterium]